MEQSFQVISGHNSVYIGSNECNQLCYIAFLNAFSLSEMILNASYDYSSEFFMILWSQLSTAYIKK